jgi:hypothetical protein
MTITHSRRALTATALVLGGLAIVGCGGGSNSVGKVGDQTGGTTLAAPLTKNAGGGNGGGMAKGDPHGKIRVVNVFLRANKPFGALDIYDVANPTKGDKPLIAGLGYGKVSDYVQPRSLSSSSMLYLFPAGSVTRDADGIGGQGLSNAGWEDGDQATVVIGTAKGIEDSDPSTPQYTEISESDTTTTWKAIPGKGAILVNASGAGVDSGAATVTLVIDGACPMRVDPSNSPGGGQGLDSIANGNAVTYKVAPGSHKIGLLATEPTTAVTACTGGAAMAVTSVDVPANGRVEAFVFGTTPKDLELVTAAVDRP